MKRITPAVEKTTTGPMRSTMVERSDQANGGNHSIDGRPESRQRESLSENFIGELDNWALRTLPRHV